MKRYLFLILITAIHISAIADNITIAGKVINAVTKAAIPEAEVRVSGTSTSVITNEDGRFQLKLNTRPKSLKVIALGYRNANFDCSNVANIENVTINMQPQSFILNTITVFSADNIVMTALEKVPTNYAHTSERLSCFYRETVRKQNHFTHLSEAVMDMYKSSYANDTRQDKVQIVKGRSLISQRAKDTLSVRVMGGPHEAVVLDMVKNREVLFYEHDLPAYQFTMDNGTTINDRAQYVIRFSPIATREYPLYSGVIYIDVETLAFTRIEASLDMRNTAKATRFMLVKKPLGLRFKPKALNIVVTYHYDGQCSRISYVRTTYHFNCDWRRRLFATTYRAVSEMVVTDHTISEIPKGRKNMFSQHDILSSHVADFNDPDFWSNYNIIEPSESLEHAVSKLKKKSE